MKTKALHIDCMEYMKGLEDDAFDLAIVDPPYGINIAAEKPRKSGRWKYGYKEWDAKKPEPLYFKQIFRVSKNQIIWGGNYFDLPPTRGFIFWDKDQPVPNFSDGELAWTSFDCVARKFYFPNRKNTDRIHPTQKPIKLYRWLLNNYAKPGDKILDTHLGSGSSRIAAEELGFDFVGCELGKDYFEDQEKRFHEWYSQGNMFREPTPKQEKIIQTRIEL